MSLEATSQQGAESLLGDLHVRCPARFLLDRRHRNAGESTGDHQVEKTQVVGDVDSHPVTSDEPRNSDADRGDLSVIDPEAGIAFASLTGETFLFEQIDPDGLQRTDVFIDTQPELLHNAPQKTKFGRMDEVKAARELVLCCWLPEDYRDQ